MARFLKPLFLIFGLLLFIWVLRKVDLAQVGDLLLKMGPGLLVIILAYSLVAWFDALSWKYSSGSTLMATSRPSLLSRAR